MLRPSIDGKRKDSGSTAARYDLCYVDIQEEQGGCDCENQLREAIEIPFQMENFAIN